MITRPIIVGEGTQYPLKGILTLPDDLSKPVPAVVFVHGSGSSNMDEKVGRLTPFKDLAEGLAGYGIASVRYDKRSYSHGFKMVKEGPITVKEETIDDAILAAGLLRGDPHIDGSRVFLVGHSMGAMLAPRIDAEGGDFRGLILMAGSPRTLREILLEQTEDAMGEMKGVLRKIAEKQLQQLRTTLNAVPLMTDEEAKAKKFGGGTTLYYFKEMEQHPVSAYLKELRKPILVLQGGRDAQVKADVDYEMYRKLLEGNDNASFRLWEELNHAFVPAIYGTIGKAKQEYRVRQRISEEVIRGIAHWIREVSQ